MKSRYVAQARVWIAGAEMLARKENFVELDPEVKDAWGIPVLKIHFTQCDNEYKLVEDFQQKAEEWFKKAGGEVMPGRRRRRAFPAPRGRRRRIARRGKPRARQRRTAKRRPLGT